MTFRTVGTMGAIIGIVRHDLRLFRVGTDEWTRLSEPRLVRERKAHRRGWWRRGRWRRGHLENGGRWSKVKSFGWLGKESLGSHEANWPYSAGSEVKLTWMEGNVGIADKLNLFKGCCVA